ncbi:hypothetical protein [Paenibacillus elgii]|uniref:hypothetical protein n=1 Tax=Paenibacillus elgii TaxID=189691 RepID=UPI00203DD606|nr:hypothetical protein [Paenibacillus elgii]MCM3274194.1 hypothetical protein [Paenibacillus elgii]
MFKVVGKSMYTKEAQALIKLLIEWGVNPIPVIKEAEKGRTTCGDFRILAVR